MVGSLTVKEDTVTRGKRQAAGRTRERISEDRLGKGWMEV